MSAGGCGDVVYFGGGGGGGGMELLGILLNFSLFFCLFDSWVPPLATFLPFMTLSSSSPPFLHVMCTFICIVWRS